MPEFSKILRPVLGFLPQCDNFYRLLLFPGISNTIYPIVTISFYGEIYFTAKYNFGMKMLMRGGEREEWWWLLVIRPTCNSQN